MANEPGEVSAACGGAGGGGADGARQAALTALPQIDLAPEAFDYLALWLGRVAGAERHLDALRAEVQAGQAEALAILCDGRQVGALVWRIEHDARGGALAVNALACDPIRGLDLVKLVDALCAAIARTLGLRHLRFWTERPGMVRKAEALGYRRAYVLERCIA